MMNMASLPELFSKLYYHPIKIVDINRKSHQMHINSYSTIKSIKQLLYDKYCKSLHPDKMVIKYKGIYLDNQTKLNTLNVGQTEEDIFQQQKTDLNNIQGLSISKQLDEYMQEMAYVANMPCGHSISRDSITYLIKAQINSGSFKISCPMTDQDGQNPCKKQWDFTLCKKVGVFTKQETEQFEDGLNSNWLRVFSKVCPYCQQSVTKGSLQTNKVRCLNCQSAQFCYICLEPWKNEDSQVQCGGQCCNFYNAKLKNSPWTRIFSFQDQNGQQMEVKTPKQRMCPNCTLTIEHFEGCKHTTCPFCQTQFCWICLWINQDRDGSWVCGQAFDYCGNVAPITLLSDL